MTRSRAVNEALEQLADLEGEPVEIEGILEADSEGYELVHYPRSERRTAYLEGDDEYRPAFWLAFGNGSLRPNHAALKRWLGKRVRVHGLVRSLAALPVVSGLGKGGFGPWGFWPAEIEPYSVQRLTAEERRDNGT